MPPEQIILALAGCVATLAGAVAALYRDQASRADARLARQEAREDEHWAQIDATLKQLASAASAQSVTIAKIAEYVTEQEIRERVRAAADGGHRREGAGER